MIDNVFIVDSIFLIVCFHVVIDSAAIFMDFKAAFPSVWFAYIFRCLKTAGVPKHVRTAISRLYVKQWHKLRMFNLAQWIFMIESGVKQ